MKLSNELTMASCGSDSLRSLPMTDVEQADAWLRALAAQARTKKIQDSDEERPVTDLFLAKAGVEAIRRVSVMVAPRELEALKFEEIRQIILSKLQPKKRLVIAERTQFMALEQMETEATRDYVHRLRMGARYCDFHLLGAEGATQSAEDELVQMRMIAGMRNAAHRIKMLEFLQASTDVSLEGCIEYAQQLELIQDFRAPSMPVDNLARDSSIAHVDKNKRQVSTTKCAFCGLSHQRGSCPAYGKQCKKCGKHNHFSAVCKSKVKKVTTHQMNVECAANKAPQEANLSVFCLGKSSLKIVKVDNVAVRMQLDTGSEATVIPKNIWENMGRPTLKKTSQRLKQYDGSSIRRLGQFSALVEMDGNYSEATIVVAACVKGHGLLGTDVLKVDFDKISVNAANKNLANVAYTSTEFSCLKGY